jgi:hypothetical protein
MVFNATRFKKLINLFNIMLEMIINPREAEKGPWKMFFIGLVYASLSLILVHWFFKGDTVLSQYSGMIVVTFCVMFSLPFIYYTIKREEEEDEQVEGLFSVWRAHRILYVVVFWFYNCFCILVYNFAESLVVQFSN